MRTGCVKTDRIEMEYFSFGTGARQMVILPGLDIKRIVLSAAVIENAYKVFADEYTVTVFDRRLDMPSPYSVREMAEDTVEAMQALSITDADIFGASQGGMIALWIALLMPERVHAMILGSTMARSNPTADATFERWIELAEQRDERALNADFVDRLYSALTVGRFREEMIAMATHITEEGYRRFLILARSYDSFDVYDRLEEIRCPVLVIGVEGDRALSGEASREIAERIGCELYMYGSEYGHCVFDEAPDYRERMQSFFHRCRDL